MLHLARILIEMTTPLHCGGGEEIHGLDQPVLRDAFGDYTITGATIAGVCRAFCAERYSPDIVERAFGAGGDDGEGSQLWVSDAALVDFDGLSTLEKRLADSEVGFRCGPFIRDQVRIDHQTGAAAKGGKFDIEFVPPGTRFCLEFSLESSDSELVQIFISLARAFEQGILRLGGLESCGFGAFRALEVQCRSFDLETEEGMTHFLNLSKGMLFTGDDGGRIIDTKGSLDPLSTNGFTGHAVLPMITQGPMLVGGGTSTGEADLTFSRVEMADYKSRSFTERLVAPGSSLRGVVRHRVLAIAESLGIENAQNLVNGLFGHVEKGSARKGKLSFRDAVLSPQAKTAVVQHVAIDRFTGGALDGALYNEAPVWSNETELELRVDFRDLSEMEAALLMHALMDLCDGVLPVGGGVNRGNGIMRLKGLGPDGNWPKAISNLSSYKVSKGRESLTPEDNAVATQWLSQLEEAVSEKAGAA